LADLRLLREALDDLDGLQGRGLVRGRDRDLAGVLDVDLAARRLDDRADRLAARADDVPDAVARDLDREDPRREGRDVGAGLLDGRSHAPQDVQPARPRLRQSLLDDLAAQTLDLDVHLERGDAVGGPRDLEVHVAVVVFLPGDVGQDRETLA